MAHIIYLQQEHPDIYEATYKFLEPKDYLNMRLTGRFAASYDSITLHWVTDNRDINHIRYSDQLLNLATIDRHKLPDLKKAVDILGPIRPEAAAELGIPDSAQVIMGTPEAVPELRTTPVVIGKCARGFRERGVYVPGCPPHGTAITDGACQALGIDPEVVHRAIEALHDF